VRPSSSSMSQARRTLGVLEDSKAIARIPDVLLLLGEGGLIMLCTPG
jgi:hypothetical protein